MVVALTEVLFGFLSLSFSFVVSVAVVSEIKNLVAHNIRILASPVKYPFLIVRFNLYKSQSTILYN